MTTRAQTGMEPSADAVQAMRERLRALGFLLTDDATRDLLRPVLGIESARLDRYAREAAAACLRSIQDAAGEALAILTQGPAAVTAPMPAVAGAGPKPAPPPRRDQPVNLAEIVRQRLGDDLPKDDPALRPHEPPPAQSPGLPQNRAPAEPRRPVFKRPRGR
jgi:hypothetical protein